MIYSKSLLHCRLRASNFFWRQNCKLSAFQNSTSQPTHLSQSLKHIERPPNKLNHLKISNGPDLLSINTQSDQKTIGFVLKSGVTDEFKSGTSYLVSKMALNSSKTNENKLSEKLAAMNTVYDIQTTRDATFFAFSTGKENLSELFQIFSKAILNPDVCQETLDEAKIQAKMHMQGVREMRDPEVLLKNQLAYTAAYEGTALAKPIVYSDEEIDSVSLSDIENHIEKLHDVQNMLIVSVGPKMSRVHDLVEEHFLSNAENKIKYKENSETLNNEIIEAKSGVCLLKQSMSSENMNANPLPELAHVVLSFPMVYAPFKNPGLSTHESNKLYAAQLIMQTFFGGGSSFSAGGPGKGLHSKFYVEGLCRYNWLQHLSLTSSQFKRSQGLMMLHGSCQPNNLRSLSTLLSVECLGKMYRVIMRPSELEKCRRQLKLNRALGLEQVPALMENIACSWLNYDNWMDLDDFFRAVDSVEIKDVEMVAKKIIEGPMSLAAMGNLDQLQKSELFFRDKQELFS